MKNGELRYSSIRQTMSSPRDYSPLIATIHGYSNIHHLRHSIRERYVSEPHTAYYSKKPNSYVKGLHLFGKNCSNCMSPVKSRHVVRQILVARRISEPANFGLHCVELCGREGRQILLLQPFLFTQILTVESVLCVARVQVSEIINILKTQSFVGYFIVNHDKITNTYCLTEIWDVRAR